MSHDASESVSGGTSQEVKKPWAPPSLTYEGRLEDLVQAGSKSGAGGDPGDIRKPPGQS